LVKKLLNPFVVSAFILVLVLGSLAHLMYGSCQTSKYHYMCQAYWMPDYLPGWMIVNAPLKDAEILWPKRSYSGVWRS